MISATQALKVVYSVLTSYGINANSIYSNHVEQGTPAPYIMLKIVDAFPTVVKEVSPLDSARVQIDIYAETIEEAYALEELVRSILDFYTGTIDGVTVDGISYIQNNPTDWDDTEDMHRLSSDYKIRLNR